MAKTEPPTLTDAAGMGGLNAQDGFDYQVYVGLQRLPRWLRNPAFEHVVFEALEDIEARFFAPHAPKGHVLDRLQAKSGALAPAGLTEVMEKFHAFEKAFPGVARSHTLITPKLPSTMEWLGRDPARVADARPFYAPFADVIAASEKKLLADLQTQFGRKIGSFVAGGVDFAEQTFPNRDAAMIAFTLALNEAFPDLDAKQSQIGQAFDVLFKAANAHRGKPLSRSVVLDLLWPIFGEGIKGVTVFPIHLHGADGEPGQSVLVLDGRAFTSKDAVPTPERWNTDLLRPMIATATWLKKQNVNRVSVRGSFRLPTAFALGWALRSALGFELETETRVGFWATDDRPVSGELYPLVEVTDAKLLEGDVLVVSIGVIRPAGDTLIALGKSADAMLRLYVRDALPSAAAVQSVTSSIKGAIDAAVTRLQPARIHVYYAGPHCLAVALGHRWNALPPTRLFEFAGGKYHEAMTLP